MKVSEQQFFAWVQKHAKANGLTVKRHFGYYHPDGLLLELVTLFEGTERIAFDGECLFAPNVEELIEMQVRSVGHKRRAGDA